jgi:hypothetical protein
MAKQITDEWRHTRVAYIEETAQHRSTFFQPIKWGLRVTPELVAKMPEKLYVVPPEEGALPDIFGRHIGFWTVSDRVKALIEELEPNVHMFLPVRLHVRKTATVYSNYFIFSCGNVIDAIVIDESDFVTGHGRRAFEESPVLSPSGTTTLDARKIEGRHIWRAAIDNGPPTPPFVFNWFCSDTLADRLQEAGYEYWGFAPCVVR